MLELKNVSKYYYNKGVVSSGFSHVSLKFDMGEFIAITGESGSGKSTLLNVISGLDSYEDGEMYIDGKETSHYSQKDYELYRRKYIGNIFQNFNLVNSYTVYQNIELVLLINGKKRKDVKDRVIELIKEVNLYKYKNTKVSKLSGGQKQRVAIARALAADTPIILADEPTGNLDKESSSSVLKLLHKISKDKLVIVVTHNYDQIEEYVTRKITMSDGRVLEDKKIKKFDKVDKNKINDYSDITFFNKVRLSLRNAFNIIPKFLIIFAVYAFILFSLFFVYGGFEEIKFAEELVGWNNFFTNFSSKRIIIKKNDNSSFSDEDYENISKISNVDKIEKNDLYVDNGIYLYSENDYIYLYGYSYDIDEIDSVDYGKLPNNDNEIVYSCNTFYYDCNVEDYLDKTLVLDTLTDYTTNNNYYVKIVGINEYYDVNNSDTYFYFTDSLLNKISYRVNQDYSSVDYTFNSNTYHSYFGIHSGEILPSDNVSSGKAIIPSDWSSSCKNNNCTKYNIDISIESIYYKNTVSYNTYKTYTSKNIKKVTGYDSSYNGCIFINTDDYYSLFSDKYYQSSVFIKDEKNVRDTINELESLGIHTLYLPDTSSNYSEDASAAINIFRMFVIIMLLFTLFFISYFIIKLVLKSRNKYYSTLRILGTSYSATKDLLLIELFIISSLSYIVFVGFILLSKYSIIDNSTIKTLVSYTSINVFCLLYLVIIVISLLITNRYSRKLFVDSAMNTFREEV